MAYARHQSFYFREKWLSKGLNAVQQENHFFFDELAFEKVGLGKNMVEALRFWLIAFNTIEEVNIEGQKLHRLTQLGELILNQDKLSQTNDTLSILQYELIRNEHDQSTVFDWFFNHYKETVASKPDLLNSFIFWVSQREVKEISEKSLKKDIDCIVQFYTKSEDENDPEDVLFSPFSRLGLVKSEPSGEGHEIIKKISPDIHDIGIIALHYILLHYCVTNDVELISVNEIVSNDQMWGKAFNLSRNKIIEALNILSNHERYPIQYVRTNNLDYIRVMRIEPMDFLRAEYARRVVNYGI
ncbi:MAG: DUF4007 family protein [Paenibacillaceae bacterium]